MNEQHKKFVEEYLSNGGIKRRAYMAAYPHIDNVGTASTRAGMLMKDPEVQEYLKKRQDELWAEQDKRTRDMFQQLYDYAFREKIESYSKEVDHTTGEVKKERTYEYQPSVEDSIKAISTLGDWLGLGKFNNDLIREKMEAEIELIKKRVAEGSVEHNVEINIVDPWTEEVEPDGDEED